MEYVIVALKDAGEGLAGSLRGLYDAGRVWIMLVIGIGVVVVLLRMLGRFRRGGF